MWLPLISAFIFFILFLGIGALVIGFPFRPLPWRRLLRASFEYSLLILALFTLAPNEEGVSSDEWEGGLGLVKAVIIFVVSVLLVAVYWLRRRYRKLGGQISGSTIKSMMKFWPYVALVVLLIINFYPKYFTAIFKYLVGILVALGIYGTWFLLYPKK